MENSGVSSSGKTWPVHCNTFKQLIIGSIGSTFMELDEVIVPAENMLGSENQGFEIIMSSMNTAPHYQEMYSVR